MFQFEKLFFHKPKGTATPLAEDQYFGGGYHVHGDKKQAFERAQVLLAEGNPTKLQGWMSDPKQAREEIDVELINTRGGVAGWIVRRALNR